MSFHVSLRGIAVAFGLGASLVLTGCGSGGVAPGTGSSGGSGSGSSGGSGSGGPTTALSLSGAVYGGQQPLAGATVNLYVAGTSGYGTGATSLLSGAGSVTTDSSGKFKFSGDFSCPSTTSQVYAISKGGNAGAGANNSSVLMSAVGNCSDLGSDTVVNISAATSVASVYALSQFMKPGSTVVGTSSSNVRGLVNAFSTVANLVDVSTGLVRATTSAGNGTVPQSTIDTLANIMAACVVTNGSGVCQQLSSLATPPGGIAPADTLSALLDIALNPGNNVAKLFALQSSSQMFQPALAGAPSDWTLSLEYSGGGLNAPQLPAVDAMGNIWIPNAIDPGTLSEFSWTGEALSGTNGFSGGGLSYPEAVAVDLSGNIWSANEGLLHGVSKHTSNGAALSGTSGYTSSGLVQPVAIALDAVGNVFTANLGNSTVTKLNSGGTLVSQFTGGGLDEPYSVAIDTAQNVWITNSGASNSLSKFSNTGSPANGAGYTGNMSQPVDVAIDANGNVWVANFNHASVSEFSSTGTLLSGAGYTTPADVSAVAIDGNNTAWTANTDGSISHLSTSGARISPATGYISPGATGEVGIALDASGNVWTTDNYVDSIFEYVGVAAPTVTPLQLAVKNKTMGQRP